jgi:S-adenosylhomocysteine hydrolase
MKDPPVYQQELPVLEAIVRAAPKDLSGLHSIAFVCVQHLLFTTISLLESLVKLGIAPSNIHITGKSYSSSPLVIDHLIRYGYHYHPNMPQQNLGEFADCFKRDMALMWQAVYDDLKFKNISLIVILDDGGMCLTNVPAFIAEKYALVGIEQTTSGLTNPLMLELSFPVIEVASSAAKQILESPLIAEAVVKKLDTLLPTQRSLTCGVVGMGLIGAAISHKLISLNHKVITYDLDACKNKRIEKAHPAETLEEVFLSADYIFGCSGEDITEGFPLDILNKEKTFISCSSQDKEFRTLLKLFKQHHCVYHNVLDNLDYTLNNQNIHIIRGGFPVNLDNSGESVSARDIQLTRGLLLSGALQAIRIGSRPLPSNQSTWRYMLNPTLQSFVVSHWIPHSTTAVSSFARSHLWQDDAWIAENSKGFYVQDSFLEQAFRTTDKTKKPDKVA